MRKEKNSTDLTAHFSDVWANAQRSRSALFKLLVLEAWRQLFRGAAADGDWLAPAYAEGMMWTPNLRDNPRGSSRASPTNNSTDFGTSLPDVWADARSEVWAESRRLRRIIFRSLLPNAWRRLFRKATRARDKSGSKTRQYQRA